MKIRVALQLCLVSLRDTSRKDDPPKTPVLQDLCPHRPKRPTSLPIMSAERPVEFVPLPAELGEVVGTAVSLYSGAGGLDLGFAAAGFRPIWANDIDPLAV